MRLHGIDHDVLNRNNLTQPPCFYPLVLPKFMYNMTDMATAFGIQQLGKLDRIHSLRKELASRYNDGLQELRWQLPGWTPADKTHMYVAA